MTDQEANNNSVNDCGKQGNTKSKVKQRKGQTDEEYRIQKAEFEETGPVINTQDWFIDNKSKLETISKDAKIDRKFILNAIELLYFRRRYDECLQFIEKYAESMYENDDISSGNSNKKIDKDFQQILHIKSKCTEKLVVIQP
ncbi:uncharacterized protein RJT21DRAFT_114137 [Scheffersomyces amazonensis]|uniref:uncharacterized protein n=1 Tax=Scheffersomyces amazonensis TaxID=1078765 RepID=UPI00315DE1C6